MKGAAASIAGSESGVFRSPRLLRIFKWGAIDSGRAPVVGLPEHILTGALDPMAMLQRLASLIGLLFALIPLHVRGAEGTLLRWNLKPGERLRYEFRSKNQIKVKGASAQPVDNASDLTVEWTWKVIAVDEQGTAELRMTVDRVLSVIRLGTETTRYDSREKTREPTGSQPLTDVYRAVLAAESLVKLDARGRITEARVPAGVIEALRNSAFLTSADAGSLFTDKGLKNLLAQAIPTLPQNPIDLDSAWTTDMEMAVPPIKIAHQYKERVASLTGEAARLDARIQTSIVPEAGSKVSTAIESQSGTRGVTFDRTLGRLTESAVKQTLELKIGVTDRETEQAISLDVRLKRIP